MKQIKKLWDAVDSAPRGSVEMGFFSSLLLFGVVFVQILS